MRYSSNLIGSMATNDVDLGNLDNLMNFSLASISPTIAIPDEREFSAPDYKDNTSRPFQSSEGSQLSNTASSLENRPKHNNQPRESYGNQEQPKKKRRKRVVQSAETTEAQSFTAPNGEIMKRPPFTYADILEYALSKKEMITGEIYDWIKKYFPFFRFVDQSKWQAVVRHTLTVTPIFKKSKKTPLGHIWKVVYDDTDRSEALPVTTKKHWKTKALSEHYLRMEEELEKKAIQHPISRR